MARESTLVGKAWQSVSWLVLGEAAGEAAALASSLEHQVGGLWVGGSNPSPATKK